MISFLLLAPPSSHVTAATLVICRIKVSFTGNNSNHIFNMTITTLRPLRGRRPIKRVLTSTPPGNLRHLTRNTNEFTLTKSNMSFSTL